MATTFPLKQGETRTSPGSIPHPSKHPLIDIHRYRLEIPDTNAIFPAWDSIGGIQVFPVKPGAVKPWGALTCQRYMGMCHFDDPLFRLLRRSRDQPFYTLCQFKFPPFFDFSENLAYFGPFLSNLDNISAPNTLILGENLFPRH